MKYCKIIVLSFLLLLLFNITLEAMPIQNGFGFKVGVVNPRPSAMPTSIALGLYGEAYIDENVAIGLDMFYYSKTKTDTRPLDEDRNPFGVSFETSVTDYETTAKLIPLLLYFKYSPPALKESLSSHNLAPYIGAGIGYEMLYVSYTNYEQTTEQSTGREYFGGLGWKFFIGTQYFLGSRSSFIGELAYNGATVSKEWKDEVVYRQTLNVGNIGLWFGLQIDI